jgi:PAS domain S-box-containing protein
MKDQENKILFVQGRPEDRLVLERAVKESGYSFTLFRAASYRESLELVQKIAFNAVVSDYQLTDGLAIDLLPWLGNSPLIILAEEGCEGAAINALKAGAHNYMMSGEKNQHLNLLPILLAKSIEQKKQRDELENYRTRLESLVEERTTELTDMYLQLQESEANFRNIFNNTSDGFIITEYDFTFLEANNTLLRQFGVTREYLAKESLINFLAPAYHSLIFDRLQMLMQGLPSGDLEIEVIAPLTGEVIPFEINNVPIMFNHKKAILTVMRNITERKSHARNLFETIILTEEEERSRIARDLHDETGPLMSALKIYTTTFMETSSAEKKNKLAGQIGIIMRDVIESIKEISNDMSPHVLVNFGLLAALRNIINLFNKGMKIHLESNLVDVRFPNTVESVVYRVLKELINNTVKHAKAGNIYITLEYSDSGLLCNYRDDGVGFDWQAFVESKTKGMGINNISSRIHSLGGDYEIVTSPGNGFSINLVIKTSPIL